MRKFNKYPIKLKSRLTKTDKKTLMKNVLFRHFHYERGIPLLVKVGIEPAPQIAELKREGFKNIRVGKIRADLTRGISGYKDKQKQSWSYLTDMQVAKRGRK
jgi:hypothetical protein